MSDTDKREIGVNLEGLASELERISQKKSIGLYDSGVISLAAEVARELEKREEADPVSEIRRMRGDAPAGNAAAMREALEEIVRHFKRMYECDRLYTFCTGTRNGGPCLHEMTCRVLFKAQAALSATPRNCDRFATAVEAERAFSIFRPLSFHAIFDWLFAPAEKEGGAHA